MGLVQRCARPMVVHNEIIEKELEVVEGTQYVTRESILRRAQEIKGIPLRNVDKTGRLATGKGAIGTVIEESWFGYTPNSESEPDFPEAGVELKVTPYLRGKNGEQKFYIDNVGRISEIISSTDSVAGDDLYHQLYGGVR